MNIKADKICKTAKKHLEYTFTPLQTIFHKAFTNDSYNDSVSLIAVQTQHKKESL
jgi:hypothetical protein